MRGGGSSSVLRKALAEASLKRSAKRSRTGLEAAVCYMEGAADGEILEQLRRKLSAIDVGSLSMSQESVAECLSPKRWYNPFPKVRYTERPDVAAACLMEGDVLLMLDNSASVMILMVSNDIFSPPFPMCIAIHHRSTDPLL